MWRLQTEDGNAMAIRPFADERMAINMSVWESLEALQQFVYRSAHVGPLRDRKQGAGSQKKNRNKNRTRFYSGSWLLAPSEW